MRDKPLPDMDQIFDGVTGHEKPQSATQEPQEATERDKVPRSATKKGRGPLEKHHVRIHAEDWKRLEQIAQTEGVSASTKLRMILREWIGA